jgi:hypothetical protein
MADSGWKRPFEDPIPLPRGRQLVTLQDAGDYITKLPKAEHEAPEWQAAMEALILVATLGGPTMFRADRRHESAEPPRRARVQLRSQGSSLGKTKAQEGRMNRIGRFAIFAILLIVVLLVIWQVFGAAWG